MINILISLSLVFYGMYLRIALLWGRQDLWNDESYQFDCIKGHFKAFWLHQTYGDFTTFPGEYILNYPVVALFGRNKWAIAFPHFLVTLLGFYLLWILCRKYMKSWVGFFVTFLIFVMNDNLVSHALEFRPYAVLPVMALGSLYIAHQLVENSKSMSLWGKVAIAGSIFFTINYHAYGILIIALPLSFLSLIHGMDLIYSRQWSQGWKSMLPWKYLSLVGFVSLPVWLWYASYNHCGFSKNDLPISAVNPFEYIADPLHQPVSFLKCIVGNLLGDRKVYILLIGILFIFILSKAEQLKQVLFLLALVVLPISLILYFDVKSHYWFLQRQFVWVTPFFILWLGFLWDRGYIFLRDHFFIKKVHRI